jgi:hypothetical protein
METTIASSTQESQYLLRARWQARRLPLSLRSTFPTSTHHFPRLNHLRLRRRTPTPNTAIDIGQTQNAAGQLMSRQWRIYKGYADKIEMVGKTDGMAGPPNIVTSRSARYISRLGSLLCSTGKTKKSYAPRHPHTMLLSSTILSLQRRQRPHSYRLSRCPPLRGIVQDFVPSRYNVAV